MIWRALTAVPILRDFLLIANAYAFSGQEEFVLRPAPFRCWCDRVLLKPTLCVAAALVLTALTTTPTELAQPAKDVISVFPNLLGFAVALYGLIFAIPMPFWRAIRARKVRLGFTPETINADFAFPIMALVAILGVAWLLSLVGSRWPYAWETGVSLFLYGLALLSELVALIFFTIDRILRDEKKIHDKR